MIILNAETKERIREYHRYHGDIRIKIVKVIKDSKGYDAVLVRVQNKAGEKYSCLDLMDSAGDFSELDGVPTEREQELIERFTREWGEDMGNDEKCRYRESCGYDFCHGEGVCPEFEEGELYTGEEEG